MSNKGQKGKAKKGRQVARKPASVQQVATKVPSVQSVTVAQINSMTQSWKGPTPPPQALEHYERIVTGSASRIIALAERQAAHVQELEANQNSHRINLESIIVEGTERRANIGQWTSLFIAILGLSLSGLAFVRGASIQGAVIAAAVFAEGGIVWFLGGRPPRVKKAKSEK